MRIRQSGALIVAIALVCAASVAPAAPQSAGVSHYSAGLGAQLFSDMPTWPASADEAHAGMEAAARFVPKEAIAANRADADARMAAAAMLRDPEAVDRDPNMQGVAAWEKLIASHDPVHPNNDRIDVLIKRMDDIAENFRTQHEQHQITFKQQADLHMTSCAQVRQYYVGSTNAQYAIAQGENAALRVSTSRCKVTAAHSPLTPTSPGGRGASRQLLIRPNRDRSAIATFSGREKGPELRDYGPFLRPALRAGFAVRSGI